MMFSAGDTLKQLYPELDFSTVSRLSRSTAAFYWDQIQSGHWRELEDRIISEWRQFPNVSHHTDSIVVVDEFGNVAAMSHTINTWSWGFTGFFVDGVSIPDAASHQQKIIAYCGAGNYIYDLLAPAIVLREGRPYLVSGCNGFHIHELTLQHLYNILHHNYYPADSLARGMFEMVDYESNSLDRQYIPRGALSTNILNRLIEMGQPVTLTDEFDQFWIGIRINPDSGLWGAVSDVFSGANSYVTGY
jgi:gamma-glutamyltranspeptidase/glutathione hydrolase